MLIAINNQINKRIQYGIRIETALKRGYKLQWSNTLAKWFVGYSVKTGEQIKLDANEILVYGRMKDIVSILPKLNSLPLYANSYEYKHTI